MLLMLCTRVKLRSISNTNSSFGLSKVEYPSKGLSSEAMAASSWAETCVAAVTAARLRAVAPSALASVLNSRRFMRLSSAEYPVDQVALHRNFGERQPALFCGEAAQQEPVIPVELPGQGPALPKA